MELRLECGDGIHVDAGFRKRVPLRYCSDKKRMCYVLVVNCKTYSLLKDDVVVVLLFCVIPAYTHMHLA